MLLTNRLESTNADPEPEDLLSSSLSVIFPDTVANQHGDASNALEYVSPHLPRRLRIELADPPDDQDRLLFGHYLWNASLLAAELVERGTLAGDASADELDGAGEGELSAPRRTFDIRGKSVVELGAGTALPSTMAALLGAAEVVVTDYPSPTLLATLRANVARNISRENSPEGYVPEKVEVLGHSWGEIDGLDQRKGAFDIVIAADCLVSYSFSHQPYAPASPFHKQGALRRRQLSYAANSPTPESQHTHTHADRDPQWMPWQHQNLLASTAHLLKRSPTARAWIIAGFHTGRRNMRGFFDPASLRAAGLVAEYLWEVDCMGVERAWAWEREGEDVRRWCSVGVLKWIDP